MTRHLARFVLVLVAAGLAGPAFADAIDGNWCHQDGRRFAIRGPQIVTPGGKQMEGNYGRHDFSYTAPTPERGAGGVIVMLLLNENTVRLRYGEAADSTAETWMRCAPSISAVSGGRRPS